MVFWKISEAALTPKRSLLYRYNPACVEKVVMYRQDSSSSSWWYALDRSNLLKTVDPLRSAIRSSTVGMGCFSRSMASLALRMSMQILTPPPVFLGTSTTGLTHGVGPVTSSMTSRVFRRDSSASTSFRTWKGMRLCRWVIGGVYMEFDLDLRDISHFAVEE